MERVRRRGRRPVPPHPAAGAPGSGPTRGRRWYLVRLVLVGFFGLGLAVVVPGTAQAEGQGEALQGTLQARTFGPIEDVEVSVTSPDGDEVGTATTDENGRWEVELPGPGSYVVTLDSAALPEGVTLNGEDTRTVEVGEGRRQGVIFSIADGSRGGGGTVRAVQLAVDGLRFGLLIAISAVGLSLIFGTTGLVNFAHGELVTIGAVAAWFINVQAGVPFLLAALMALVVGGAVGALNELGLWRPLRNRGTGLVAALVVSIGLSLALRYLIQVIYGGRSEPYAAFRGQRAVDYGLFRMTNSDLVTIVVALVVLVLIAVMLQKTKIGKAMRAVSDNRDLAASSGINVNRVILVVWVMGGALAALGGVLLGLTDEVQWDMGFRLLLLMFAGVTLGGLGTAYGALVGGVVVGLFVQMSTLVIPNDMKYVGGLLLLIVILVIRPQGILGSRARIG
jgi:branched-chain amino acid transport system permease protein